MRRSSRSRIGSARRRDRGHNYRWGMVGCTASDELFWSAEVIWVGGALKESRDGFHHVRSTSSVL
jgi:hypothetical protein